MLRIGSMLRIGALLLTALLAACRGVTPTPISPATSPASTPTDAPGISGTHALPHELRWVRDSAEYRAILIQTYRFAGEVLEARAADLEPGGWAVSLDADETIIDNSLYQKERHLIGQDYDSESWAEWVGRREATSLPGAPRFLDRVRELGGKIAIVTNRKQAECPDTEANLNALSIPFDVILCRRDDGRKEARWQQIQDGTASPNLPPLDIVMWLGDNIQDFPHLEQGLKHQPEAVYGRFGIEFFVLPNPMYGSWDHPGD